MPPPPPHTHHCSEMAHTVQYTNSNQQQQHSDIAQITLPNKQRMQYKNHAVHQVLSPTKRSVPQGSPIIPNPIRFHRCPFPQGPGLHCSTHNPAPKSASKSQQISGTNRPTDFSTKQLPTDVDHGSRPQTHLPFGCCAIRVMWKLKVPLNFFCVPDAQGVIECTQEDPGKLKVHLCTAQVHPETGQTKGLCIMLA